MVLDLLENKIKNVISKEIDAYHLTMHLVWLEYMVMFKTLES